jgi:hypothetical protein
MTICTARLNDWQLVYRNEDDCSREAAIYEGNSEPEAAAN